MKASTLKGALLEYIVRNLLKKCGFTNVKPDGIYTYIASGLFFVNGKGAAHDADIIMNPPIQMPFSYPSQLIFECKAYRDDVGLTIVRNALGFRYDVNEFEIVTKDSIKARKNNKRATYAIETRTRYLFQVGVAAVNDFTKPAIEFASNNKIPLLSLNWFLPRNTIRDINNIDQALMDGFNKEAIENLYQFFKDREGDLYSEQYTRAYSFLNEDNSLGDIVTVANTTINFFYVGLLETGDMVFLFARNRSDNNVLNQINGAGQFKAEIHWNSNRPSVWTLTVINDWGNYQRSEFDFFVPDRIMQHWQQFNLDKMTALDIKQEFFSKIFVFNKENQNRIPFSIINIDKRWLDNARQELETNSNQ